MKQLLVFFCSAYLMACYCQTRAVCPSMYSEQTLAQTKVEIVQPNIETTLPTENSLKSPQTVTAKPAETKNSSPRKAKPDVPMVPITAPIQQVPAFTSQEAATLIAQERSQQTLPAPPTDTPIFKKEDTISTAGRLLNPLAYEPILPDNTQAPWSNESLQYGIYYSFIKAGTAYIKTRGLVSKNGKTAYVIQTTAFSASVIDSMYKVRDVNYSWLDTTSLHSLGYSQSLREGNYRRDEWITFDEKNGRFYGQVQKKEEPHVIAGELKQQVLDILTSLYYVRSKPLQVGHDVTFDIINREQQYPLIVKVLKKETVKTPAGKFNCWVVEPQFRGEGIFVAKGKSLKVWLTDDKYRMPVKMSVEVFIGSVTAELLAYQRN